MQGQPIFALLDTLRRAQADALGALGYGSSESAYRVLAAGRRWRLRDYSETDARPPLLIVTAPIKRPYIWDLAPSASAVRYCLDHGLRVYLLEWIPPSHDGTDGLDECARAIAACIARVASEAQELPFLMGHSLGGTLAAIAAALDPQSMRGLALLNAPLCFAPATSRFRDAITLLAPSALSETDIVPGSLVSQLSAQAAPDTFIWSRLMDAAFSIADPSAIESHARVERWALDEAALPGRLVRQIFQWLYREDHFCRGTLIVCDRRLGPSDVQVPTLAIVNTADDIAPRAAVAPFLQAIPTRDVRLIEYPGESGVGLQHLAILAGRRAYARVWPEIITWINAQSDKAATDHRPPKRSDRRTPLT